MSVHEALDHPWLSGAATNISTETIPSDRYYSVRDSVRQRYVSFFFVNYSIKSL